MFAGPLLARELITSPRQVAHYAARGGYVAAHFVLIYTIAQSWFGWREVRNVSELAAFGQQVFGVFALVQLVLGAFFGVLFSAGKVAEEKDRRTLLLLLVTDLRDSELVLGKLGASLLMVLVLLTAGLPVFAFLMLLGGVDEWQIACVFALSVCSALCAGAWGTLVAFWKDKTFQTLAISVLGVVLFVGGIELVGWLLPASVLRSGVLLFDPFRTLISILQPLSGATPTAYIGEALQSCGCLLALAVALIATTIVRLRVWNPSRSVGENAKSAEELKAAPPRVHRPVWQQPVVWREMCTRAYGRKILIIKLAFLVVAGFAVWLAATTPADSPKVLGMIAPEGFAFVGIGLISLLLINAQAVTAITGERDAATLELLLVTDISAQEFTYGKLGGVLYNSKELIAGPLALAGVLLANGRLTAENFVYVALGYLTLVVFAAMLGLHSGLAYDSSRQAIATSLGTVFFLFIGIFLCMMLIVQARSSFALQLPSFLVFILGGSIGLWSSLTHRNPSPALGLAAGVLPFGTFYAITSFLLGQTLGVCLLVVLAYGFTVLAMLVPAVSSFDAALGRNNTVRG